MQKHAFQANNKDMMIDYQTMRYVNLIVLIESERKGKTVLYDCLLSFSQAYMNIVTGGCLAIACRYAGTCNQQAYSCLVCVYTIYDCVCVCKCMFYCIVFNQLQIIRGILSRTLHTSSEQVCVCVCVGCVWCVCVCSIFVCRQASTAWSQVCVQFCYRWLW